MIDRPITRWRIFALGFMSGFVAPTAAPVAQTEPLGLSFPLACRVHETCFLQNYVDLDRGPGVKDYRCGGATYEGHKGTDFRAISARHARTGMTVRAAAPGRVKALRDGVPDILLRDGQSFPSDRACGNGVVISHRNGWETQYCHLKRGSLRVKRGQLIARGEPIGQIGYSGAAEFAHLHFAVRKSGEIIDPFTGRGPSAGCASKPPGAGLWDEGARAALDYREGELIEAAFSGAVPPARREALGIAPTALTARSPALVFAAHFINLKKGDRLRLIVTGPKGPIVRHETKPIDRNKAGFAAFAGRKLRAERWPVGRYRGTVELVRAGKVIVRQERRLELD